MPLRNCHLPRISKPRALLREMEALEAANPTRFIYLSRERRHPRRWILRAGRKLVAVVDVAAMRVGFLDSSGSGGSVQYSLLPKRERNLVGLDDADS